MDRDRPITLPRNFLFRNAGNLPKTPEPEDQLAQARNAQSPPQLFRVRRRARPSFPESENPSASNAGSSRVVSMPSVNTALPTLQTGSLPSASGMADIPLPSIETTLSEGDGEMPGLINKPAVAGGLQHIRGHDKRYLSPVHNIDTSMPRTPVGKTTNLGDISPSNARATERLLERMISDSDDNFSDVSSDSDFESDGFSYVGNCTSPESDAPDPAFSFSPGKPATVLNYGSDCERRRGHRRRQSIAVNWTVEMDNHLWNTYMQYLQDPTVTPFKMLPGCAPPLGACSRVARLAGRLWRATERAAAADFAESGVNNLRRNASSVTITSHEVISSRSTLKDDVLNIPPRWPTSNAATRKRLRELCKRRATIAPHYQRLLQSRSPSPFSPNASSPRPMAARLPGQGRRRRDGASPFAAREVQISLATSTASTMQPTGPLAQLSSDAGVPSGEGSEWFNDSSVPWAPLGTPTNRHRANNASTSSVNASTSGSSRSSFFSRTAHTSQNSIGSSVGLANTPHTGSSAAFTNEGSRDLRNDPFIEHGFHGTQNVPRNVSGQTFGGAQQDSFGQPRTWGPSQTATHLQPLIGGSYRAPAANQIAGSERLQSPFRMDTQQGRSRFSTGSKRRAQNALDEDMSPSSNRMRRRPIEDLFGRPTTNTANNSRSQNALDLDRAMRTRGMSLNTAFSQQAGFHSHSAISPVSRDNNMFGRPASHSLHNNPIVGPFGLESSNTGMSWAQGFMPGRQVASASNSIGRGFSGEGSEVFGQMFQPSRSGNISPTRRSPINKLSLQTSQGQRSPRQSLMRSNSSNSPTQRLMNRPATSSAASQRPQMGRLGSPFVGINTRPTRPRGPRHLASASLPVNEPAPYMSFNHNVDRMDADGPGGY